MKWCSGTVLSIKLRDDLFTLAQMREHNLMQFFAISKPDNVWAGTDLNAVPSLGMRFIAERNMKTLFVGKQTAATVTPTMQPIETRMLRHLVRPDGSFGADLIDTTPAADVVNATLLKADLDSKHDLAIIYQYELCGMLGDAEKLRKRLLRFFDTGINWDDAKSFLFKQIALPPPHWQPGSALRPNPPVDGATAQVAAPTKTCAPAPAPAGAPLASVDIAALDALAQGDYLAHGARRVLGRVRPAFEQLLHALRALPANADDTMRLAPFAVAFELINTCQDDIGTVERETILGAIYAIGKLAGLAPESQFAEAWRGDW